ncbi:helix-turn-helix transcriptional regulator [Streptomyces sp. NBC_01433]|uniref:helix-turn-helix domain-containing protein n=1 Tax=Streptomyces sp. NBC_01433 TaxID=2903864 RepID=UPI0022582891|nr:helix-turn-helix transcriptional regulator [Streptomyces sp. NBC_01433]MCX4681962.1 helix-turn-helix transcriptional regulator [Streptomyces sp. NBC_01433]
MSTDTVAVRQSWAEFGRRLRALRRSAGMTQRQLALRVGYHHTLISKLEGGVREPPAGLPLRLDVLLDGRGELLAILAGRPEERHSAPLLPATLFSTAPRDSGDPAAPQPVHHWPGRLLSCPLHSGDCEVPPLADALTLLSAADGDHGRTERWPGTEADAMHALTALIVGYTQDGLESVSTGTVGSVERVLRVVVRWAETLNRRGTLPVPQLRLAAECAQIAGWLRVERGQRILGMTWFARGLTWADVADDVVARATLLCDVCTLVRLDGDAASALAYAQELGTVDPHRAWMVAMSHLHQARARALGGDLAECRKRVVLSRRALDRLDGRDFIEAPWLGGATGRLQVEASIGGTLRDAAVITGALWVARQAVKATEAALSCLPATHRPTVLLLTLRLADAFVCSGQLDAAVAAAAPVLPEAVAADRTSVNRELAGLRTRLTTRYPGVRETRCLLEQIPYGT